MAQNSCVRRMEMASATQGDMEISFLVILFENQHVGTCGKLNVAKSGIKRTPKFITQK
jgi:hypothetical protein